MLKSKFLALATIAVIALSGCGKSYHEVGKIDAENRVIQDFSENAGVFSINKDAFANWQSDLTKFALDTKVIQNLDRAGLLVLADKYSKLTLSEDVDLFPNAKLVFDGKVTDELGTEDLRDAIGRNLMLYLHTSLMSSLNKVSDIQPDGMFKLDPSESTHLLFLDYKRGPKAMQSMSARVINAKDYELSETVIIKHNQPSMLTLDKLAKVTLTER